ncbi:MAG: aldolase [Alphaproteobacteria bacterium]|nr:aldolase [Alphaproteobacteria bacterium]
MESVHGTTVAIDDVGVLLRGPPGSGKSDLALRMIDEGAMLVADDRSALTLEDSFVVARAPDTIAGKLEVRGVGVVQVAALPQIRVSLVVDLASDVDRLPAPQTADLLGVSVPLLQLRAFDASTPAKIRLAVRVRPGDIEH